MVRDFATGLTYNWGYSLSPVEAPGKELARLKRRITAKNPNYQNVAESLIYTTGYVYGIPSAQINIALDGAIDMMEGRTNNPMRLLFREVRD